MMPSGVRDLIRWSLIVAFGLTAGMTIGNPAAVMWLMMGVLVMTSVALTRGRLESLLGWYLVLVAVVNLVKRLLFVVGPVDQSLYHQIQAAPYIMLLVMLVISVRRFYRIPWVFGDFLVGLFFLMSIGFTMWKSVASGTVAEGTVSLIRYSGATLGYYVGRTLDRTVWKSLSGVLGWVFVGTLALAFWQFAFGPTYVDAMWARCTADTSVQAVKVVSSMAGLEPMRAYATFSDPLAWGLFLVLVWVVVEAGCEEQGGKAGRRILRRGFFLAALTLTLSRSPLLAGAAMLCFQWVLRLRTVSRPGVLLTLFAGSFYGVVVLIEYLLENVLKASWFPNFASPFLSRMLDIGTLTQRGYAVEEWGRAIRDYTFSGVGWHEHASLTSGAVTSALFQSHNGIISLVLVVGIPGLLVVILWFASWMRGVTLALRSELTEERVMLRWAAAMVLGYASTVFVSGPQFMNEFFWLMMGWTTTLSMSRGMKDKDHLPVRADGAAPPVGVA